MKQNSYYNEAICHNVSVEVTEERNSVRVEEERVEGSGWITIN